MTQRRGIDPAALEAPPAPAVTSRRRARRGPHHDRSGRLFLSIGAGEARETARVISCPVDVIALLAQPSRRRPLKFTPATTSPFRISVLQVARPVAGGMLQKKITSRQPRLGEQLARATQTFAAVSRDRCVFRAGLSPGGAIHPRRGARPCGEPVHRIFSSRLSGARRAQLPRKAVTFRANRWASGIDPAPIRHGSTGSRTTHAIPA